MLESIKNISPIDGRYSQKTKHLQEYFSEAALIKYRILVEVEYFKSLCNELGFEVNVDNLEKIYQSPFLSDDVLLKIKQIEKVTNHDVKAVEYFLKENLQDSKYKEFIHFGLTSQDINNTAIPLLLKDWLHISFIPSISNLVNQIEKLGMEWCDVSMLARTHGQPASPTRVGKEFKVFVERLEKQISYLNRFEFSCKFGGATGNLNAHYVSYPNKNWKEFVNNFTHKLDLKRNQFTTQIDHYDNLAELFDALRRINTILIDFCRDIWSYISMDYFKQKTKPGEIGSSAMPHKVNPIDFENAEGNLGIANAIFTHLSEKLPISRLQRDLTDSTVLRNIGVPIAHTELSIDSIQRGLNKLILNKVAIDKDLDDNWAVVAEAIQTILRREFYPDPYEKLKLLTRGNQINQSTIKEFIEGLDVHDFIKQEMLNITPSNYIGK